MLNIYLRGKSGGLSWGKRQRNMGWMEKQYHAAAAESAISEQASKQKIISEPLFCFKVKLLQRLSTSKLAGILRSGILIWGLKFYLQSAILLRILWRIWTKVSKTEMTEGKTFIKSPDFPLFVQLLVQQI